VLAQTQQVKVWLLTPDPFVITAQSLGEFLSGQLRKRQAKLTVPAVLSKHCAELRVLHQKVARQYCLRRRVYPKSISANLFKRYD